MFCAKHPRTPAGRLCARCRLPVCAACLRWAGTRACCGEPCAAMLLLERASAAAWAVAVQESRRSVHGLPSRLRLLPLRWAAWSAQRELDAHLDRAPLPGLSWPWIWKRIAAWACALPRPPRAWGRWARVAGPTVAMVVLAWAAATAFVPRQATVPAPSAPALVYVPVAPGPALREEVQEPEPEVVEPPSPSTGEAPAGRTEAPPPAAPPARPRREAAPRPGRPPRAPLRAADLTWGNRAVQAVALTFDAHSEGSGAEEILEVLRTRGVRVTVFLTGGYIRKYPELVRRLVAEGHEVGNHMNTHPRLTSYARDGRQATSSHVTREFVQGQLRDADAAFREATGRSMAPLWRAPYGEHNGEIRAWAAEAGYQHVGWTRDAAAREDLDSRDWVADTSSKIYRSASEIRDRILRFGQANGHGLNGGIVLMHLGTQRRRDQAHTHLPEILDGLAARGYRLVTVSEMLRDASAPPDLARASTR